MLRVCTRWRADGTVPLPRTRAQSQKLSDLLSSREREGWLWASFHAGFVYSFIRGHDGCPQGAPGRVGGHCSHHQARQSLWGGKWP